MRVRRRVLGGGAALALLTVGCTPGDQSSPAPAEPSTAGSSSVPTSSPAGPSGSPGTSAPTTSASSTAGATRSAETSTPSPSATTAPSATPSLDPANEFWVADETWYSSPWFAGTGRIMIGFGCTEAPYYVSDPTCEDGNGFHHGIDVALPCGTDLVSDVTATVVDPATRGRLGEAYGSTGFRLRDPERGQDVVIGHAETVAFSAGQQVRPGDVIARVGDRGSPDGCHLHLELRPSAGDVFTAVDPTELLALRG